MGEDETFSTVDRCGDRIAVSVDGGDAVVLACEEAVGAGTAFYYFDAVGAAGLGAALVAAAGQLRGEEG